MEKIAVPLFDRRVSPRFDCAGDFLIAAVESGEIVECRKLSVVGWDRRERVKNLREWGVDTLICGGVDKQSARLLISYGIRMVTWVTGLAEDALHSFLRGELESGTMVGSGGRSRGRWRFRKSNSTFKRHRR